MEAKNMDGEELVSGTAADELQIDCKHFADRL
jgi:hypothetical protein